MYAEALGRLIQGQGKVPDDKWSEVLQNREMERVRLPWQGCNNILILVINSSVINTSDIYKVKEFDYFDVLETVVALLLQQYY